MCHLCVDPGSFSEAAPETSDRLWLLPAWRNVWVSAHVCSVSVYAGRGGGEKVAWLHSHLTHVSLPCCLVKTLSALPLPFHSDTLDFGHTKPCQPPNCSLVLTAREGHSVLLRALPSAFQYSAAHHTTVPSATLMPKGSITGAQRSHTRLEVWFKS